MVKEEEEIEQESRTIKLKENRKRMVNEEEEIDEEADTTKGKKKQKTKEEMEAEALPLAVRTSVQTLKRTMYIGAHVSGAGGSFFKYIPIHPCLPMHLESTRVLNGVMKFSAR